MQFVLMASSMDEQAKQVEEALPIEPRFDSDVSEVDSNHGKHWQLFQKVYVFSAKPVPVSPVGVKEAVNPPGDWQ